MTRKNKASLARRVQAVPHAGGARAHQASTAGRGGGGGAAHRRTVHLPHKTAGLREAQGVLAGGDRGEATPAPQCAKRPRHGRRPRLCGGGELCAAAAVGRRRLSRGGEIQIWEINLLDFFRLCDINAVVCFTCHVGLHGSVEVWRPSKGFTADSPWRERQSPTWPRDWARGGGADAATRLWVAPSHRAVARAVCVCMRPSAARSALALVPPPAAPAVGPPARGQPALTLPRMSFGLFSGLSTRPPLLGGHSRARPPASAAPRARPAAPRRRAHAAPTCTAPRT